jgi:lysophospholipase L1-like esterase
VGRATIAALTAFVSAALAGVVGVVGLVGVVGVVGASAAAAAAAAIPPSFAPFAPAPPRQVWIQGDSVMLGAANQTSAALAGAGWAATVAAFEGLSLPAATTQFGQHQGQLGSVVVVELGANDFGDPPLFGQQIDPAMAAIGDRHVIWLTVSHFTPQADALNAEIHAAAARWPNLTVADWASVVLANPNAVYSDGLHLTPSGYQLMAAFVLAHVTAWYDEFAGPSRPLVSAFGSAGGGAGAGGAALGGNTMTNGAPRAVVANPAGPGYWVVGSDGGVMTFGGTRFFGSTGGLRLTRSVVGMAARPTGSGYWLVAADGGIFSFGDAPFFGSTGAVRLNQPVVGMAVTRDGGGYWLVAADGGIFTFGDARFLGSTGALRLNQPIVGMAATPDGAGYWLVAADGGIFTFGDARFFGSGVGTAITLDPAEPALGSEPASFVSLAPADGGRGYWLLGQPSG